MKTFVVIAVLIFGAAVATAQYGLGINNGLGFGLVGVGVPLAEDGWGWGWPQYKYSYGVADKHTGDYKHAEEHREGEITKGSYSVLQPDGILRTVKYVVTPKGGFQAQVINTQAAHHNRHGGLLGELGL